MDETKFFFEPDTETSESGITNEEHADTFFNTLKEAGIIHEQIPESMEAQQAQAQAAMSKVETRLLQVEFGTYLDNYAVHITPTHPQRNLSDELAVKKALKELVLILNDYVPYTLQVQLHLPQSDWKMKVLSAVVVGGASAWNFDTDKLEKEGIPRLIAAIESIIQGG